VRSFLNSHSFLPESPRYLISKDRDDEAFEILAKYHAEGDRDSVFVKAEVSFDSVMQREFDSGERAEFCRWPKSRPPSKSKWS